MITKLSHAPIFVLDQDEAYDFYINKLGFAVRTDAKFGEGMRWLTVGPKEQPDMEIILMPIQAGMMFNQEQADSLRKLVEAGVMGAGVWQCDNIYATCEELKAKGVRFKSEPKQQPYGIEAIMLDNSGNWFSLGQKG